jgi:hypothetical protein
MHAPRQFHEAFEDATPRALPPDRQFGFVMTTAFAIIASWPLLRGAAPRWWLAAIAVVILAITLTRPRLLRGGNRLWMKFGELMGRITRPVMMGALFFLIVTPVGIVARLLRGDPLRLRRDPDAASYWIPREPRPVDRESLTRQF